MIKIFKGKDGWYVRHVSPNGKTLCISEAFRTRANALKNIRAMMKLYGSVTMEYKDGKELLTIGT